MPLFLSSSRFLRVTFPPEQFGMGEGVEQFFDKQGNTMSKRLPHRPAKFEDGQLREERPARVEMLRKHPGNLAKNGTAFWEQSAQDTAAVAALSGKAGAMTPVDGLTAEDIADLRYLETATKHLAPRAMHNVRERAIKVHTRFRMVGILPPQEDFNINRCKARVTEMLGVLLDNAIWDGVRGDTQRVDTGRGKAADG